MKKKHLLLLISVTFCLLCSCKKETNNPDSNHLEEFQYKAMVEQLVNLSAHPISSQELENSKLPHLDFNTYKEAYTSFKAFLDSSTQIVKLDVPNPNAALHQGNALRSVAGIQPLNEFYYNYAFYADPQITRTISGTFGLESILLLYHLYYVLSYGPATVTQNSPSNAVIYYSGFGTGSSQQIYVRPTSQSTNTGTISGAIQITGSIAGVPYSVYVTLTGSYNFTVPTFQEDAYRTVLVTTLTVKGS